MKKLGSLLAVLLVSFLCMGGVVRAEQHDRLLPLLGDLEGWQAQPAHGMSLISAQMRMISANRVYSQDDKTLTVNIMVNSGPVVDSDLQESSSENEIVRTRSRQVDGFWTKSVHSKKSNSGQVIVYLDYNQEANGVLVVNYTKMNEEEALRVIETMDWNKFKQVVSAML